MTGGSYRVECYACENEIPASARFCPRCGVPMPWVNEDSP